MLSKLVQLEIGISLAAELLGPKLSFLRKLALPPSRNGFPQHSQVALEVVMRRLDSLC